MTSSGFMAVSLIVVIIALAMVVTTVHSFHMPRHFGAATPTPYINGRPHANTLSMAAQAKMGAQTQVEFKPSNIVVSAKPGAELSEVAKAANVEIKYKCRKGECGTCEVRTNGKWIKTCQTTIPALPEGEIFQIETQYEEETGVAFFSPKSLMDGFFNNAAGMAGFGKEMSDAGGGFTDRLDREKKIAEMVEKKRLEKEGSKK